MSLLITVSSSSYQSTGSEKPNSMAIISLKVQLQPDFDPRYQTFGWLSNFIDSFSSLSSVFSNEINSLLYEARSMLLSVDM